MVSGGNLGQAGTLNKRLPEVATMADAKEAGDADKRVVVLGDCESGKTSTLNRFCCDDFSDGPSSSAVLACQRSQHMYLVCSYRGTETSRGLPDTARPSTVPHVRGLPSTHARALDIQHTDGLCAVRQSTRRRWAWTRSRRR